MFSLAVKNLVAHKRRFFGTLFAVLLGVAFLSATLVVGDTARASFDTLFAEGNASTDVVVRGAESLGSENVTQRRLIDESLLESVQTVNGVAVAIPVVDGLAQLAGSNGDPVGGNGPPTLGGNWIDDASINPYVIADGRAPTEAGEVVINKGAADAGGLAIGDVTTVRTPTLVEVEVVGIATYGDRDGISETTFVAFTLDQAQQLLLGRDDALSSIRAQATEGVSQDDLAAAMAANLPDGVEAITGEALTAEQNADIQADFIGWFEMFLLAFSGVALLVATFTINNTFTILLAQRTRESALLRAVGASRGQILRSIAVEATVVGVVASAIGFGAGIGLAWLLRGFFDAEQISVDPASVLVALAAGVGVTLVAALVPAIRTSRIAPMAALRETAAESRSVSWKRVVLGAALVAPGLGIVIAGGLGVAKFDFAVMGLAALLTVTGAVVIGPVVARLATGAIGWPLPRVRGVAGDLARRNAMRNPKRTAGTATALMIGVAVVTLFMVVAASVKSSIDTTLAGAYRGDFVVMNQGWSSVGFDPALADDLAALDEVSDAVAAELAPMRIDGRDTIVAVGDPAGVDAVVDMDVTEGSLAGLRDDQMAMSEAHAEEHNLSLGSPVEVGFADGAVEVLEVGAIYRMEDLTGDVLVPTPVWAAHADQRQLAMVLVTLAPGVDLSDGRQAIDTVAAGYGAPDAMDRSEYLEFVAGGIDQALSIVYVMLGLSILIAAMGIANTLAMAIHERTSELGLLRAVGQTRRQLRSMVRWESTVIAVFGAFGGVALGALLAWGLISSLSGEGFNTFAAPLGQLALVVTLGAVVGVVAAVRPARRAARLDILAAIRSE